MPRGRKPSPKTAVRAQIRKLESEVKVKNRAVKKHAKAYDILARRLGALERAYRIKESVIRGKLSGVKWQFDHAEASRADLSQQISNMKASL